MPRAAFSGKVIESGEETPLPVIPVKKPVANSINGSIAILIISGSRRFGREAASKSHAAANEMPDNR